MRRLPPTHRATPDAVPGPASTAGCARRPGGELASAARSVGENARKLLEHTAAQSTAGCDILAALHRVSSASARALDVTSELSLLLDGEAHAARAPSALLGKARAALAELCGAVAQANGIVHRFDVAAQMNATRAQELWCAVDALARRASEPEQASSLAEAPDRGPAPTRCTRRRG